MMAVMLHQDNTCDYVCEDLRCVCGRRMRSGAFWAPGSPASPFRAEIGLGCNLRGEVDRGAEELRLALRRRMTTVGVTRCWSKPDWNSRSHLRCVPLRSRRQHESRRGRQILITEGKSATYGPTNSHPL